MLSCASEMLGDTGRILANYSGKANLCILRDRVMYINFTISLFLFECYLTFMAFFGLVRIEGDWHGLKGIISHLI